MSRRLTRAIFELKSYRDDLALNPWQSVSVGVLNTVIATLSNLEYAAPRSLRPKNPERVQVDAMISQVNAELRDDDESEAA